MRLVGPTLMEFRDTPAFVLQAPKVCAGSLSKLALKPDALAPVPKLSSVGSPGAQHARLIPSGHLVF